MFHRLYLLLVILLAASAVLAQTDRACVTVPRCAAAPVMDGATADPAFAAAVAQPGTTCATTYDDHALYFAFVCHDPDADRPRALVRAHDDHPWEDDCVQIFIAPEDLDKAGKAQITFGGYAGAYDNWYADIKA